MAITSKVQICNMALSHLGNFGTVSDIDTPKNSKEITFSLWYDISRQQLLKLLIPNFALKRKIVAKLSTVPAFGYDYAYEYPNDALKVLGFNNIDEKDLEYAVENNMVLVNQDFTTGLKLRYVGDVTDVNAMSPEFKMALSWYLAGQVALDVTQDPRKAQNITNQVPFRLSEASGMNAQENPPIRKSTSKFRQARYSCPTRNNAKR